MTAKPMTQADVNWFFDRWKAEAQKIDRWSRGSKQFASAVMAARRAWTAYELADDEVNQRSFS
jgi:hypothetical protein